MTSDAAGVDAEFAAMKALYNVLEPLDDDARKRVMDYIVAQLEIPTIPPQSADRTSQAGTGDFEEAVLHQEEAAAPKFNSFAELYDAAQPATGPQKALVSGYWLQVCQKAENFDGFSVNKELKDLGHGLANITNAIDGLRNQKPAFALQLRKSGKSQQARKTYKLTVPGIRAVETMING